jgi:hypothetical protein
MTTARDIVKKSLQKIGALTKNDDMSGDEASDGLFALNSLLGSWSNESLIIYSQSLEDFPLISGQTSYTMGAGGDFDTQRPMKINNVFVRQGGIDYSVGVIGEENFDNITYKELQGIPEWMTTSNNFPLTILKFYPVPTGGITAFIRSEKPTTKLTTLDTVLSLPDGWERALIYNLALEMSPDYGQPVTQEIYQLALQSKGAIKTAVMRNRPMDSYPTAPNVNDINSGYYR